MKRQSDSRRGRQAAFVAGNLLVIALASAACGRTPTSPTGEPPTSVPGPALPPSPTPTPPGGTSLVVTGIVSGDGNPLRDARVEVRALNWDFPGNWRIDARVDGTGRYRVEKLNSGTTTVWVTAYHDHFRNQPCAVWFDYRPSGRTERTADVSLSATAGPPGAPLTLVAGQRRISGTVYTLTPTGKQPVSGASAYFDLSDSDLQARTTTDVDGRFMLCGLPLDRPLQIVGYLFLAPFQSQQAYSLLAPGGDADIELILK